MIAAVILILFVVLYRVISGALGANEIGWLHNFSPMAAVALCGAMFFPRRLALVLPIGALLVSDLILNAFVYHLPLLSLFMIPSYVALGLSAWMGWTMRDRPSFGRTLGAAVVGSIVFYIITNTGSWLTIPEYPKNAAGWLQALTVGVGVPGYPTTLEFYRHTFASDLLFTALFCVCMGLKPTFWRPTAVETPAPAVQ